MLSKITRGNQLTIPKNIVEKAGLTQSSPYVDVEYANGIIFLKLVTVEEKVHPEQFDKFQKWALRKEEGNQTFRSLKEGIRHFEKRTKKK